MGTDRSRQTQGAARRLSDVMVGSVGWVPRREPVEDELAVAAPDPPPRAATLRTRAVLALALVVVAILGGRAALSWWTSQPQRTTVVAGNAHTAAGSRSATPAQAWPQVPAPAGAGSAGSGSAGSGSAGSGSASGPVVVDVVGHVRRPGLVRLPEGSRVADAVSAAGGAASGAALFKVNLARRLSDGEQVVIPGAGDPVPVVGAGSGGVAGSGAVGPVDLNAATEQQLDSLPGVGPVTAGRVVAWRAQHGRFSRVDELGEVPGIGPKLLAQLKPLVRV